MFQPKTSQSLIQSFASLLKFPTLRFCSSSEKIMKSSQKLNELMEKANTFEKQNYFKKSTMQVSIPSVSIIQQFT
jgi:nitrogenase subunit NifH